jgi:hypothetical protein
MLEMNLRPNSKISETIPMKNQTHLNIRQRDLSAWRPIAAATTLILVLAALALAPLGAHAQQTPNPPGQISYQGFLTDANGIPLATNAPKNYVVTFTIYDAATGGNIKWAENQTVTVDRGYFSVLLGQGTASGSLFWTNNLTSVFSGPTASTRFIGLTVAGLPGQSVPSEIQPRLQLLSSPYSLLAANANAISSSTGAQILTTFGSSVGIGETPSGNDALDVRGNIGLYQNSFLDFGEGINGQASQSGRIGYDYLSPNALDIVGAGTTTANEHVKIWAGGGTSTTGPLGVEIDTPATALDVNGGAFISSGSGLASAGGRYGISLFYDNNNNTGQIQSVQPGTANQNLTLNANGGNVGVGNLFPQAKLHVSGNTYLDGYAGIANNNVLEFGRGVSGKEANAGKIGYQSFTAGALDIVGAGTTGANRAIKLWAEGGITATGNLAAAGTIGAAAMAPGGNSVADGVFSMQGVGHLNDNRMYIRGGTDHNHWIAYDNSLGEDGIAIVGNVGGELGNTLSGGGYQWDCYWLNSGSFYVRSLLISYGPVYAYGGAYVLSDRNAKQNIEDLDSKSVLTKLADMPVTKWSYTNTPAVSHVGPMAQDFAAAFGYGMITNDNKTISLNDEIGVSLAAIKGLNQKVEEKDAELQALKKQVADLRAIVDALAKPKSP